MAGADLGFAEQQRAVDPAVLDGRLECAARNRRWRWRRAAAGRARRPGPRPAREASRLKCLMMRMHVGVGLLEELVQPVDGLDVRIAAHLAEDGGAFDGLVADGVELAEKSGAFDFSHRSLGMGSISMKVKNSAGAVFMIQSRRGCTRPRRGRAVWFSARWSSPAGRPCPRQVSGTSAASSTSCDVPE